MASRFEFMRVGVGVVALLLVVGAGPASADPVRGTVQEGGPEGLTVNVGSGFLAEMPTSLIKFRLADGTELGVYCVQIQNEIDPEHPLVEKDWEAFPDPASPFNANRAKINWILHNGFPVKDTDELEAQLVGAGVRLRDGLSTAEAIAGTQAAVWHFSDDTDLDRADPVPDARGSARDVVALYDFLTGDANAGIADQPSASLKISPADLTGKPGQRIGPFTVRTSGAISRLDADLPDGVRITDENGAELAVAAIKDGTRLFIDVPADAPDGSASFELTATAEVAGGRLFVGESYAPNRRTQSVIVARSRAAELTATAGASWTAAEVQQVADNDDDVAAEDVNADGDLAETGASILTPTLFGAGLLAAGFAFLLFRRHRTRPQPIGNRYRRG
ncbi:MAG TPA: thioester domain-containing protein [Actinophytocola sp.]|uniref:thioester domain-containing protein n=1 Tax=Actinophytocola sp. TaxID=1872138 RepID=UPI002DDD113A|nr:thioester domain-containing protein [Actinophytocola sp.]HEV2783220.1 thioester domain-containing protein [Actinophytocola sp.]